MPKVVPNPSFKKTNRPYKNSKLLEKIITGVGMISAMTAFFLNILMSMLRREEYFVPSMTAVVIFGATALVITFITYETWLKSLLGLWVRLTMTSMLGLWAYRSYLDATATLTPDATHTVPVSGHGLTVYLAPTPNGIEIISIFTITSLAILILIFLIQGIYEKLKNR